MRVPIVLLAVAFGAGAAGCSQPQSASLLLSIPARTVSQNERRPSTFSYRVLYAFRGAGSNDAAWPTSGLIERNGVLYGTSTAGGKPSDGNKGTIYSITPSGTENVLHSFGTLDGAQPFAGLTVLGDRLYGTTSAGGTSGNGVIFEVDAANNLRVLHDFAGGTDGAKPLTTMLALDGGLYGTTETGAGGYGTVFKHNLADGTERVLYAFNGGTDGKRPRGNLIDVEGSLYGTTLEGGETKSYGTVYEVTRTSPPAERVVYRFKGAPNGVNPQSGLVALDGALYGTTQGGGTGYGTVFEVRKPGEERVIYSFKGGNDGSAPVAPLVVMNGLLYGTTSQGGSRNAGTVFEVSKTGTERVIYTFLGTRDGEQPFGLFVKDNTLYGTTRFGGTQGKCTLGCGTVYAITL